VATLDYWRRRVRGPDGRRLLEVELAQVPQFGKPANFFSTDGRGLGEGVSRSGSAGGAM